MAGSSGGRDTRPIAEEGKGGREKGERGAELPNGVAPTVGGARIGGAAAMHQGRSRQLLRPTARIPSITLDRKSTRLNSSHVD